MDAEKARSHRLIRLTEAAYFDLASIDNATAATWGEDQAERYIGFLNEIFAVLVAEPNLGSPIEDFPDYLSYTAKYAKGRNAHGHRIFYTETDYGIRIIRILHTAMQWENHIDQDNV